MSSQRAPTRGRVAIGAVAVLGSALLLSGCSALQGRIGGLADAMLAPTAADTCASITADLPSVQVLSGTPTLAAAWDATGAELARYLEGAAADAGGAIQSGWRDAPDVPVAVCVFDGDFETITPGPPGNDRHAVRVLIVVADGRSQLWWVAKEASALPLDTGQQPAP